MWGSQIAAGRDLLPLPSQPSLCAGRKARRGDTGCPLRGDPGPRATCCPGPPSHCVSGAVGGSAPIVCPMVQARSRGKTVACEPKGKKAAQIRPSSLSLLATWPAPSAPPLTPGPERVAAVGQRAQATVTAGLASRPPLPLPATRALPRPPVLSICRRPLLRAPGADCCPEEHASCRVRPAAPDKLAICCCLSSAFVMQIPEPAAGAELQGGGVVLIFFSLS